MDTKINYDEQVRICEKQISEAEHTLKKLKRDKILAENNLAWIKGGVYLSYKPSRMTTTYMSVYYVESSKCCNDGNEEASVIDGIIITGVGFTNTIGMMFSSTYIETRLMKIHVPLKDFGNIIEISPEVWISKVAELKESIDSRFL